MSAGCLQEIDGIQLVISKIFIERPMPVVRTALGDDVHNAGGSAAKFRGVVRIDDAKFLNRLLGRCPPLDPRGRRNVVGAIYRNEVVVDVLSSEGKLGYRFNDHIRVTG